MTRIGDEVVVEEDSTGQWLLRPDTLGLDWYRECTHEAVFESLPTAYLTEKEERLQHAIESLVQN